MKIHHLNCGSLRQIDATYPGPQPAPAVNHCLLVETDSDGLVLVETGLGLDNVRDPAGTLGTDWVAMAQPLLDPEETAIRQVARLGYAPADVRHIILTHLDVDHCGGLPDFPQAKVHVLAAELAAAQAEGPNFRYRDAHWAHGPDWVTYHPDGDEDWFGFRATPLTGLPSDFKLIPLGGHTAGHTGVAVREGDRWLLHCGDAYYYHRELTQPYHPHPVMDVVQTSSEVHHDLRVGTRARLRELVRDHGAEVSVFSAHDPWEFSGYN
ncbi:MBL fold metallo-hydrolase [Nocardia vulneris]|uniref:Beta-lactamase n=1 Tax=Nocardia vulneris TaxID=1141657 RepID=A0ABR4ZMA7_9NOCA|nr:MBL fold metallo-hydrolase [Nocardia vulneris]KIA66477.1 beta-lactamase [Nocardia vulneris]